MKTIKRTNKKNKPKPIPRFPPPIGSYDLSWSPTLRFEALADIVSLTITQQNILDTFLVAVSAVQGYDLFNIAKIRKVRMWCPSGNTSNLTAQSSLRFIGTTGAGGQGYSDDTLHVSSSMGGMQPGVLSARPKPNSNAGMFFTNSNTGIMQISCPLGTVIDMHMTMKSRNGAATTVAQNALVGAVIGVTYFRGLDGLATATTNLAPTFGAGVI